MSIKITTNISNEFKNIEININSPSLDKKTKMIIDIISSISDEESIIAAEQNNHIYILHINDIFCFYSDEKYNYCTTKEGNYKIRSTLHELEEKLNKTNWIRISNSCILNLNHIRCFDMGTIGSIVVILENGEKKDVSKRRIKEIAKLLKDRRMIK